MNFKEYGDNNKDTIMLLHGGGLSWWNYREEAEKLKNIFKEERWIIDGNYQRTLELRLKECDTVFLLDFPLEDCLSVAESCIGIKREDLPWIEENLNEEFRTVIIDFPNNKLPKIYELIEKYKKNKNIVIFKTRKEADEYLEMLKIK